uniref:Putative ribonuclease H-like domain-containing protein n=1 Tax=Tanacetum cinerariifolium TaxID=118510 RepID=A0A6L2MDS7_TANCI|nr:putative ribonuclease H-like domain-containing protein [Tanacetum cinerariifolium]
MELETTQTSTTANLPMLKQGNYEMWRLRIEQYFQFQDYALWDVIENKNSFVPVTQTTTTEGGAITTTISSPVTTEEKIKKKNDVKTRSMLLMTLPNEHMMTFNQYKDAKSLFAAIEIRFGGNEATKKTQKTLLKQMYENFSALSTESLNSIFNRLQKIISQLAVLGKFISQEDLNLKFLRSLSSEWNAQVMVWRNKHDLDTISIDDLYNNFKIVKQKVKGIASSNSSSQNMAFVSFPSTNSTNKVHTAYGVNIASIHSCTARTQVGTASNQTSTANLSDATVYAFLANQSNGTRLKTKKKITINGSDTAGFDKSKIECYNYHKMGHFARECKGPRNQDSINMYQDSSRRTVHVEETPSKAMVAIDRVEEFKQLEFKSYRPKSCEIECKNASKDIPNKLKEYPDAPLVKDVVLDNKDCSVESTVVVEKKIIVPTIAKVKVVRPKQQDKPVRKTVRHMTGNMSYLSDFKEFNRGYVTFGEGANGGRITSKGTIKTGNIDFEDVYFVKELKFNLFSVSQMCDIKNNVLFTDTEYLGLSPNFKLPDESQILLRVPRKNNMYSVDMKNIVPKESLTFLVAKATLDQSMLWHRRPATKDETTSILKKFTIEIENLVDKKVKIIRCDNGTEFKNSVMNDFCAMKGIRREFSVARTPQQNGVADRRNMTLIEAARTMLADSKLPTTFWAEIVNTACYVQNRVLVVKPHNKTLYKVFRDRTPALSFMRPFGCHVTILNILDHLSKFDEKADEGFFVRYSINSKAFRVYNIRTRRAEENFHIEFLENKHIVAGDGPEWLFDIDMLTKSMNYVLVVADGSPLFDSSPKISDDAGLPPSGDAGKKHAEVSEKESGASNELNSAFENLNTEYPDHSKMSGLETIETYDDSEKEADFTNLESSIHVSPTPTTRIYKNHPLKKIIGNPDHPDKVYKVVKALYGLHQAPIAWYETLAKYLLGNGFHRGKIDHTLFIKRKKGDILLVQVYVDDIIFGSAKKKLCVEFERLMKDKFQMSSMRKITFFLGLQVKQKEDGIFISQDKYVAEVLRKFNFSNVKSTSTLVDTEKTLVKDADGDDVDVHLYRSMIGSLMYLTTSRPDIIYLKGQPKLGLWYPRDSPFELIAYTDSDYAGASLAIKSTTRGCQFLGNRLISWQCKKQTVVATYTTEAEYVAAASCYGQVFWIQNQMLDYGTLIITHSLMANLEFCDKHNMVAYLKKPAGSEGFQEIVDFLNGSHIRYALTKNLTIYVSLIEKFWQTDTVRTVDNEEQEITAIVHGKEFTVTEAFVRRHIQLADVDEEGEGSGHPSEPQPLPSTAQPTNKEPILNVVSSSHQKTQTPRITLNKVTELPQTSEPIPNVADEAVNEEWDDRVERAATTAASLDAEQASGNINRTQSTIMPNVPLPQGIGACGSPRCQEAMGVPLLRLGLRGLKLRVTKLEKKKKKARTPQPMKRRSFKVRVESSAEENLDEEDPSKQRRSFYKVHVTPTQVSAQREAHSQEDQPEDQLGVLSTAKWWNSTASRLFSTAEESVSTVGASMPVSTVGASMPVSTAGMVQEVNISIPSPIAVKDKAVRLQEELDEEERQRMARVYKAAQSFTEEEWENIRARVEANEELTQRLQAEERNKYTKAKRNKPMAQAQQRAYMSNYIKNMGSYTLNQLKKLSFNEIKKVFETTIKRVNTFVPIEIEVRERASELAAGSSHVTITNSTEVGSSKRAAEAKLDYEGSKRQKTNEASGSVQKQPDEEENELSQEDLQQMMMVVLVEEVYVEALQVKYPIIDWEYDLVMLWSLAKEKFCSIEPTDDKERTLWVELKRLFEPDTEDTLWKLQRYMYDPLTWRLYDTCGVHHVSTEKGIDIFIPIEK